MFKRLILFSLFPLALLRLFVLVLLDFFYGSGCGGGRACMLPRPPPHLIPALAGAASLVSSYMFCRTLPGRHTLMSMLFSSFTYPSFLKSASVPS